MNHDFVIQVKPLGPYNNKKKQLDKEESGVLRHSPVGVKSDYILLFIMFCYN